MAFGFVIARFGLFLQLLALQSAAFGAAPPPVGDELGIAFVLADRSPASS